MRASLVMILLMSLVGCASTATRVQPVDNAALTDIRAKLGLGRCDMDLARDILAQRNPGLDQEAAYTCLQQGQIEVVERLLGDFDTRHVEPPNADYSAYLLALAEFIRFELAAGDDRERLAIGRRAHDGLVAFVRRYPDSAYRQEVAPRLEALHEGMARAEYQLALGDIESGRGELGISRLRYLVENYPRSDAALEASRWLEQRGTP